MTLVTLFADKDFWLDFARIVYNHVGVKRRVREDMRSNLKRTTSALYAGFVLLGLSACTSTPPVSAVEAPAQQWLSIFDGESLKGWTPKIAGEPLGNDPYGVFSVQNGMLLASHKNYENFEGQFGHLFFEAPFSNYRLKLEYRLVGEQIEGGPSWAKLNSGVMLHAQAPSTMGEGQAFPVSVEAQFLASFADEPNRTSANICTPGTHIRMAGELVTTHCINSDTKAAPADEWVEFEAIVEGGQRIQLFHNGVLAFQLTEPQLDPSDADAKQLLDGGDGILSEGYIALQAESHPVEFRNIQILDLSPAD